MIKDSSLRTRVGFLGVGLFVLAMWMLLHPYRGIDHDAVLYTLGALAHLHPELLAKDLFLRFGSQDQFTIFSPLFASAIRWMGLDRAAAVLTFIGQMAFFYSIWLFARRLMPPPIALLSLGLVILMPSGYGGQIIFKYLEEFLTPRLFGEALTLAALTAALMQRPVLACLGVIAAAAFHPVMAAAGAVFLGFYWVVLPKPKLGLLLYAAGIATLLLMALWVPIGPFAHFDAQWMLLMLERIGFLFLSPWSFQDWVRAIIPLSTLAVGALLAQQPLIRNICTAALLTASAGLLLTALMCDLMNVVGMTRLQPWRWVWLAQVISIIVAPLIFRDGWRQGWIARTALLLTINAWMFRGQNFDGAALALVLFALLSAVASEHRWHPRHSKMVFAGAAALLALSLPIWILDKWWLLAGEDLITLPATPLGRLGALAHDGIAPAALLALVWLRARYARTRTEIGALTILAAGGLVVLTPSAWSKWTDQPYSERYDSFAQLRRQIPPGAEVLWYELPVGSWYWLERPNFVSPHQTAGIVFSRQTAIEAYRRTRLIGPLDTSRSDWISPADKTLPQNRKLPVVCARGGIEFIVSSEDLGWPPLETAQPYPEHPLVKFRLYRCSDVRN